MLLYGRNCIDIVITFLYNDNVTNIIMSTIQIRIDDKIKESAKKILDEVGVDMSSAIKIYLKQIIIHNGIPLKLVTENGLTFEEEKNILRASKEAVKGKNVTKSMTVKEAIDYLKKL